MPKELTFQGLLVDFLTIELDLAATLLDSAALLKPDAWEPTLRKVWLALETVLGLEDRIEDPEERKCIQNRLTKIMRSLD